MEKCFVKPGDRCDQAKAERGRHQQRCGIHQPGNSADGLVLKQVQHTSDQREARHQEQHRGDEAHRMGELEAAHAEAQHDQAIDARGEHGAEGGQGVLVEALARQQGARRLAEAPADGRGAGDKPASAATTDRPAAAAKVSVTA